MNRRFEEKYILSHKAEQLFYIYNKHLLYPDDEALKFNGSHSYWVHSLYYDTLDMESYNQKVNGDKFKYKIRLRDYGQGESFLELKLKEGQVGQKIRVAYDDLKSSYAKILGALNARIIRNYQLPINVNYLKPVLKVSYQRVAFRLKTNSQIKVNIDKEIHFSKYLSKASYKLPMNSVLEVKGDLQEKYQLINLKACLGEFSKYQRGVESVYFL